MVKIFIITVLDFAPMIFCLEILTQEIFSKILVSVILILLAILVRIRYLKIVNFIGHPHYNT